MEAAIGVRFRVFVSEQNVPPEEELDEEDATATHVIALHQDQTVGTGRLLVRDGDTAIIGRMEEEARAQGMRHSVLHAQEYVKSFYAAHGYREHGDPFMEVDIPHIEMRKAL